MRKRIQTTILLVAIAASNISIVHSQLNIRTIDVAGDSISKGFNAGNAFPCANGDQETYNWLSSDTHGANLCSVGSEGVFSFLERVECTLGLNLTAPNPNHAVSGAKMISDFVNQSNNIKTYLNGQTGPRMAAVFMGHNDSCSGSVTKTNASCSNTDLDPANYCKTKADSFEREFRKGLELLMTVPDTRIGVAAPVRVSQLCNFGAKANCQLAGTCQLLWGAVSICGSLTSDCSSTRIIDTYNTMKSYRDILKNVTAEYALIPDGGNSRVIFIGGEVVGGGVKAAGTNFVYSDSPWAYKFNADQISCCDCFHPSATGQNKLAQLMKEGLSCSRIQPCCKETGDPLTDGKCTKTEVKRVFYQGLY